MFEDNKLALAIEFAARKHWGQKRKYNDEPFINHPIAVAEMARETNADRSVVIAAVLHDTVEDTDTTIEDLEAAADLWDRIAGDSKS